MTASSSGPTGAVSSEFNAEAGSYSSDTKSHLSWRVLMQKCSVSPGLVESEQGALLRELVNEVPPPVDPKLIAEIMVYFSTVLVNVEDLNLGVTILIDALDQKVSWQHVFMSLPRIDKTIKIQSPLSFAFLIKVYRQVYPLQRFPTEILSGSRWTSPLNQVLLLRWCILGVSPDEIPEDAMLLDTVQSLIQDAQIAPDEALWGRFPFNKQSPSLSDYIWTNAQVLHILLDITFSLRSKLNETTNGQMSMQLKDIDSFEAAKIARELLKTSMIQCPAILLATMVKSVTIPPIVARTFAMEVLEYFWEKTPGSADTTKFFKWLTSFNPSRFVMVILGAIYTKFPNRLFDAVSALKADKEALLSVLEGNPSPFRFHLLRAAWSSDFNPGHWLRDRIKSAPTLELVREFILFLVLSLSPTDNLTQNAFPNLKFSVTKLNSTIQELVYYLTILVSAIKEVKPALVPETGPLDEIWESICKKSVKVLEADLYRLKQLLCKIKPLAQLEPLIMLIRPTTPPADFTLADRSRAATPVEDQSLNTPRLSTGKTPNALNFSANQSFNGNAPNPVSENGSIHEVHRYFTLLYTDQMSVEAFIDLMRRLSTFPSNSHEYLVFSQMIKLLFHECRFFSKYPLPELAITGKLIGKIIQQEVLVGHGQHGTAHLLALKCVLEGLRKEPSSKVFAFAVTALEKFVGPRMACCPDFLSAFVTIPEMRKHLPTYVIYAEQCYALLPPEMINLRYISSTLLMSLPLPPPPMIVPNVFSLASHIQERNSSQAKSLQPQYLPQPQSSNQQSQQPQSSPTQESTSQPQQFQPQTQQYQAQTQQYQSQSTHAQSTTNFQADSSAPQSTTRDKVTIDGLSCQRRLVVNDHAVNLSTSSLGAVEQLLNSEPSLMVIDPPGWFKDYVAQVFNSLVACNIEVRAEELSHKIMPEWQDFLALYVVKARASKEASLHQIFRAFVERLDCGSLPKFSDSVVSTTYECINILLSYCNEAFEFVSYRTYLNNLGLWLGLMTLARNTPLRGKSMDIKSILFYGYDHGCLKALLPLCCCVLESIEKSRNFRPPNPWSVGIFCLLAELHSVPGLVTPLSLRIELLFKKLNLTLDDYVGRTNHISKRNPPPADSLDIDYRRLENRLSHQQTEPTAAENISQRDGNHVSTLSSYPPTSGLSTFSHMMDVTKMTNDLHLPYQSSVNMSDSSEIQTVPKTSLPDDSSLVRIFSHPNLAKSMPQPKYPNPSSAPLMLPTDNNTGFQTSDNSSLFTGLMKSVIISPSLALFQLKPALKTVVSQAMERAIKEIVHVVCERSVSISCVITQDIVLRDFAAEINNSLVRRAAHLMAASIAGSLALVTCREPLRAALCQHLRNLLISANEKLGDDQRLLDQVVVVATADNIELGCTLVEEAVIHKALHDIEETIAGALAARRQVKAMGHQTYQDPNYFRSDSRWPASLPPRLQLPAVLTSAQLQVYRDFMSFGLLKRMQESNAMTMQRSNEKPFVPISTNSVQPSASKVEEAGVQRDATQRGPRAVANGKQLEMHAISIRLEEQLTQLKEVAEEIAFCSPVLPFKHTSETKFATPKCVTAIFAPDLQAANSSLQSIARLQSNHEIFNLVMIFPHLCEALRDQKVAYCTVIQRMFRILAEASTLYFESVEIFRESNVAGLFIEIHLAAAAYLYHSPKFPKQVFAKDILAWMTRFFGDRRLGASIILGSLRYRFLTLAQLNQIMLEHVIPVFGEKGSLTNFENFARILYVIYIGKGPEAIQMLERSVDLLSRLMPSDLDPIAMKQYQPTIAFQGLNPMSLFEIYEFLLETVHKMSQGFSPEEPLIATVLELLDNYATFEGPAVRARRFPLFPPLSDSLKQLMAALFQQWMFSSLVVGTEKRSKIWAEYFQGLSKQRLLQMDHKTDTFFCECINYTVEMFQTTWDKATDANLKAEASKNLELVAALPQVEVEIPALKPLDAFAKMIVAMMRLIDSAQISPVLVLQRALSVIVRCIHRDAQNPATFNQRAYYRLLLSLNWEVVQPNRGLDQQLMSSLLSFSYAYQAINPCVCPAFAYCWLDIISNRYFLTKLLKNYREWPHYQQLLISMFQFLYPFLEKNQLTPPIRLLYTGLLRLLLILLHDLPEFFCIYHVVFCYHIPLNAVHLRNLILSAFPRNIKLPNPYTPTLKADLFPDICRPPRCIEHSPIVLESCDIKRHLDDYWRTKKETHLDMILQKLTTPQIKTITPTQPKLNVVIVDALLVQIVARLPTDKNVLAAPTFTGLDAAPAICVVWYFMKKLDHEGRYIFLSSISNHLHYPNLHTHYFSCLLLWIFQAFSKDETIQQQVACVLIEHLVTHRPRSWGHLVTFIELVDNPKFNLWECSFISSNPKIRQLFKSVQQQCLEQKQFTSQDSKTDDCGQSFAPSTNV